VVLYATGALLLFVRFLEMWQYDAALGESVDMFFQMVTGARSILLLLLWLCISFGIPFTALLPTVGNAGGITGGGPTLPVYIPLWTIVGHADTNDAIGRALELANGGHAWGHYVPRLADVFTTNGKIHQADYVSAFLIWTCTLLISVFIINLLIARMTSTYEALSEQSKEYRRFRRVDLVLEFKDRRGAPPPLNLLQHLLALIARLVRCTGLCTDFMTDTSAMKGFAVRLSDTVSKELCARERRHRWLYLEAKERCDAKKTDHLVVELHDSLKTQQSINSRLERVEAQMLKTQVQVLETHGLVRRLVKHKVGEPSAPAQGHEARVPRALADPPGVDVAPVPAEQRLASDTFSLASLSVPTAPALATTPPAASKRHMPEGELSLLVPTPLRKRKSSKHKDDVAEQTSSASDVAGKPVKQGASSAETKGAPAPMAPAAKVVVAPPLSAAASAGKTGGGCAASVRKRGHVCVHTPIPQTAACSDAVPSAEVASERTSTAADRKPSTAADREAEQMPRWMLRSRIV